MLPRGTTALKRFRGSTSPVRCQQPSIDADVVPEGSKMDLREQRARAEGGGGSSSPKAKLRGAKAPLC